MSNASTGPFYKRMGYGRIKFYFLIGQNKQSTLDVENPEKLSMVGQLIPNGVVVNIGKYEDKEYWGEVWPHTNVIK